MSTAVKSTAVKSPCSICHEEYTIATLNKYGGSTCGTCHKRLTKEQETKESQTKSDTNLVLPNDIKFANMSLQQSDVTKYTLSKRLEDWLKENSDPKNKAAAEVVYTIWLPFMQSLEKINNVHNRNFEKKWDAELKLLPSL